ncbi:MAG TPA: hypothetical protein VGO88_03795 [Mycetocola sp.]|jgi:hypothetical protein|nr:hypothetical protein [Mycetocola sp.]MCU1419293.1 hypothetical protein [Mycetocola sp.]MCU1560592.1 hypothetical protein [Mycetocola sp.]HEV7848432.1 hypothetical protein [Mycetocola sp.]
MTDYLPKEELHPRDPKKPSTNRIIIWVIVGGIGLYLLISGVAGIVAAG